MARLLTVPSGPRAKWVVLGVWLLFVAGSLAAGLPAKFQDAENNESTSFLPSDAESTEALKAVEELQGGEQAAIVVLYRREGGLTPADRVKIREDAAALNAAIRRDRETFRTVTPFGEPIDSQARDAALVIGNVEGDGEAETILDPIDAIRERVSDPGGGLEVKVTGPAGFAADAIKVFTSINGTLLLAAVGLVFFLLILIYRSPVFWVIPIVAVLFAELATRSLGFAITELGATVNGQSSSILSVLVLGAGTDYALLLVSRYREELRRHDDRHEAMALALRTAGPAIVASAGTVVAALLCLSIARVEGTAGLGPIGALGVLVAMISMLTFLPALLVATGRWVFWRPRVLGHGNGIPHVGDEGADATHGAWRDVGERVARAPRRVWAATAALLVVASLGLLGLDLGLTASEAYRDEPESIQGQKLLAESFPAGANAPTDVFVPAAAADAVPRVVAAAKGVEGVASARELQRGGNGVLVQVTLGRQPYSTEAYDLVEPLRRAVKQAGGQGVLVGGPTAIERDTREAAAWDTAVIPPIAIAVVFLILVALLRSLVAGVLLVATVVLSFAAALGVSVLVFDVVFGFAGMDPSIPLFGFVFLVALGIDYNIFLMARVREETATHGTRQGMLRGLAVTGGVITSAGIVLAGTFSVLAVLPLVFLTEIGFIVAFGVLLDTFLVRSVLVPALVLDLGDRTWWPSALTRPRGRAGKESEAVPAGS